MLIENSKIRIFGRQNRKNLEGGEHFWDARGRTPAVPPYFFESVESLAAFEPVPPDLRKKYRKSDFASLLKTRKK